LAPQQKFVRKHVFIDRKLQGRYMLTFLIPMLVMLGFWLGSLYFSSSKIVETTASIVRKDVDNKIASRLQDNPSPSAEVYSGLVDDISDYLRTFTNDKTYERSVVATLLWVFGIGILLVIVQMVLLTIFFSHRIAGPIYRFERACHALIEWNYTDEIHLRKYDEMKNLGRLINEASLLSRQRIAALSTAATREERDKIVAQLKLGVDAKA